MYSVLNKLSEYRKYLKQRPGLNEHSLRMSAPLPPLTRKGALIWKFAMSVEALIEIVCKNDETRVFFSQISLVFYNKEIYI